MSKGTFWQRLFGGATATETTPSVAADAQGNVSFSAEQFGQLTTLLESTTEQMQGFSAELGKAQTAVTDLTKANADLKVTVDAHQVRLDKIAQVPAQPVAATVIEPKTTAADGGPDDVEDPLDAELKTMQRAKF